MHRFAWGDSTFTEMERPRRIVERGRTGKYNRILTRGVYELEDGPGATTRVRSRSRPSPSCRRTSCSRRSEPAVVQAQATEGDAPPADILEEDRGRGARATVAGGARKPASPFRFTSGAKR